MERGHAEFDILGKIQEEKNKRGWSEYELAKNSNIPQSTISTWYRKGLQPSVTSIEKICAGFNISLSDFFSETDKKVSKNKQEILSLWSCLSPSQRNSVISMIKSFLP